ncbi:MAG TPA: hypothetical protein VJU61_26450 [Polyangiaceae bacterium]|nr:hypothetical protein [Polyangiaceae bacterium]
MSNDGFERLAGHWSRATLDLVARPGFTDAVLDAVRTLDSGLWSVLPALGQRAVAAFAVAAMIALGCAAAGAGSVDRALASSFNQVELEW